MRIFPGPKISIRREPPVGVDIGSGRREPSLLPVPITELPMLVERQINTNAFHSIKEQGFFIKKNKQKNLCGNY